MAFLKAPKISFTCPWKALIIRIPYFIPAINVSGPIPFLKKMCYAYCCPNADPSHREDKTCTRHSLFGSNNFKRPPLGKLYQHTGGCSRPRRSLSSSFWRR
ncbi:hypothetical protein CLOLEP_00374 [[Clostridium] leptum DSM 753]|uniref:Uncharacterized protein n=1 Tax=[Clostridium] leptum DSM 753 TaxID=428125 RepID=A7VP99_9FIRM|nr:hypothetical protein CLOLEP_00374 [[Clostridium] leptum DSM 753]